MPTQKQYDRLVNPPKRTKKEKEAIDKCSKTYCQKVFLPIVHEVNKQVDADKGIKPPKMTKKQKDDINLYYMVHCQATYCNPGCKEYAKGNQMDVKNGVIKSIKPKRVKELKDNGAISVCRDMRKMNPKYLKNKTV